MAHSPGPWVAVMDTIEPDDVRWFMDRDGEIIVCANTNEVMTVAPADTLLIAAAPDLLAACEAVLGFEEAIRAPDCDDIERCRLWDDVLAAIHAAVAKGKGTVAAG